MSLTKIATISVLACVTMASVSHADPRQDRDRRRGRDARVVVVRPRIVARPPVVARRHFAPPVVRVAPFGRHVGYRPVHRPGLGIGVYIGSPYRPRYPAYARRYYPSPYPYAYAYGYPVPYTYVSPYAAHGDIYGVPPAGALYGGVRLDVTPRDAAVHVDGYYAGIVDDFDGALQRVALEPGPHRFEIVAPGYESVVFEVNVLPHQIVRYRADMRRIVP